MSEEQLDGRGTGGEVRKGDLGRRVGGEVNWMAGELKWRGPVGIGGEL